MPNILNSFNFTKIGAIIAKKSKTSLKKIRNKKINKAIKVVIIWTKIASIIEIQIIAFALYNLII